MNLLWKRIHPKATPDMLGLIPLFLKDSDPRPAREQLAEAPCGWDSFRGFTMDAQGLLHYPGDPPVVPLFETTLRDETIRLYDFEWVAIIQKDGSFEISRMD